ncbi:MAG: aminoglycoside phosphotransferase family protein [Phycisphaerae bacterium]|nr:aminoglycoside phosphotransferase family protein [Phycisphaerae bacterium]
MSTRNPTYPTERAVSPDGLKSILNAHGLNVSTLTPISEGWDFAIYKLNATHILRVPKRRQVAARARREVAFLDALRPLISITVPHYDIVLETEETNGLLLGYPFLEGVPLAVPVTKEDLSQLAEPLTTLLSVVHRLADTTNVAIDNHTDLLELRNKASEAFIMLSPRMDACQRETILSRLQASMPLVGARGPIHNDLRPDHILRGVTGIMVIDWTDISWGYPWEDLLHLWICCGDMVIRAIAARYQGWHSSWDDNIRTAGTWKALLEWQYSIETEDKLKAALVDQFLRRIALR